MLASDTGVVPTQSRHFASTSLSLFGSCTSALRKDAVIPTKNKLRHTRTIVEEEEEEVLHALIAV